MKVRGWIAMVGADYEGLWSMGDPHPVYFDKDEAERACKALKSSLTDAPDIVEVEIDLEQQIAAIALEVKQEPS